MIREVGCKTVLSKSGIADYCVNCYRGCSHTCAYCYAPAVLRENRKWGSFVDVKINAPDILKKEIRNVPRGKVFVSSVTDAYQPIEKKYELTRKCLEILLRNQFSVEVFTKSPLVVRDADILSKFEKCEVGITITTLDDKMKNIFEPFSPTAEEQFDASKTLRDNGIRTYIYLGPVLPGISDQNLDRYFDAVKENADYVYVDRLNLKPGIWDNLKGVLNENYPELVPVWKEILFGKSDYYQKLKAEITKIANDKGVKTVFCY